MDSASSSPRFVSHNGEQGQTFFIERQNSNHSKASSKSTLPLSRPGSYNSLRDLPRPGSYNSLRDLPETRSLISEQRPLYYGAPSSVNKIHTIRFQVVIWNIGKLDVVSGSVPMTFRVSMFWNDMTEDEELSVGEDGSFSVNSINVWKMHGRNKAFQSELRDVPIKAIEVPPVSILNVATFETIGSPDIDMLRESTRLMRWTCMYRATVLQENLRVDEFPHDDHDIHLKLAILSHRGNGKQWDRKIWKMALATADDAQNSTRIPHGLIVDQARLPGFDYNKERGLEFQFCSLGHGTFDTPGAEASHDMYLKVSLNVLRESGYYDNNIVPLLALMNVVAVSVLTFEDTEFFYRALITLNIAFVEMGIRMTTDTHLPSVGYEIRLQRILNEFFVVLMMLVLEAMFVYVLRTYYNFSEGVTHVVDWIMAFLALGHNVYTLTNYYESKRCARRRLDFGWRPKAEKVI
jgi:hypothetical protein